MRVVITEHVSLKSYNTFSVDIKARYFAVIYTIEQLYEALAWANEKAITFTVFGGGSNLLLTKDIDGLVLVMQTQGIRILEQQDKQVIVEAEAGVVWHELVCWAVSQNFGGIENLSLIPGTVGAAPVQNIGAYGVELKDVCHSVVAINRQTLDVKTFSQAECQFSYRDSFFKHHPEQWIVLQVRFKLDQAAPIHIGYAALRQNLPKQTDGLSYAEVSQLVTKTRQQRLPDPKVLANAGSFFKNPIVSIDHAEQLKKQYPDLVTYPYSEQSVKLAAGWLIDKAGLKGYREGDVGTYPEQALVMVNYGKATGSEILAFATKIQATVKEIFKVQLEAEPVIYN